MSTRFRQAFGWLSPTLRPVSQFTDNERMRQETQWAPAWLIWALLSAGFAALTAIFAKVGVEKIAPDVATLIRTVVILLLLTAIVVTTGQYRLIAGTSSRAYLFLILSGLATGASWFCYFRALHIGDAARVAPIDKLSVVLVAGFSVAFLGEKLSVTNWLGVALIAAGAWLVTLRI
jgi:bacterial/archaeal transporter family protein